MLTPVFHKRFRRDLRLAAKRGIDIENMKDIMALLLEGEQLGPKYRDHKLKGKYEDCRECHVQPDWLLIYRVVGNELHLLRTGTHTDLFE